MKSKMLLRKTCSIYASDIHFATMIFPFVSRQVEKNIKVLTILEKSEENTIKKVLENVGLKAKTKQKIKEVDWNKTNIKKIRNVFKTLEKNISHKKDTDVIILGNKIFIKKVNEAIDLWFSNNMKNIEKSKIKINIINCFSFYDNIDFYKLMNSHNYILKTNGIKEWIEQELLKAN